jgi:hypothetical protein
VHPSTRDASYKARAHILSLHSDVGVRAKADATSLPDTRPLGEGAASEVIWATSPPSTVSSTPLAGAASSDNRNAATARVCHLQDIAGGW